MVFVLLVWRVSTSFVLLMFVMFEHRFFGGVGVRGGVEAVVLVLCVEHIVLRAVEVTALFRRARPT